MRLKIERSSCSLDIYKGRIYLNSLYTEEQYVKQGFAKKLLNRCKRISTRLQMPVELWVGPFAHKTLNKEQLIQFYISAGFVPLPYTQTTLTMVFYPRKRKGVKL